jgi:N4-gp56 family major capsid protein
MPAPPWLPPPAQYLSTTGTLIDVYPFIVAAKDAWSQIAVRGMNALDPTYLPPGEKSKSDPLGQRGYAGTSWWKSRDGGEPGLDGGWLRRLPRPAPNRAMP